MCTFHVNTINITQKYDDFSLSFSIVEIVIVENTCEILSLQYLFHLHVLILVSFCGTCRILEVSGLLLDLLLIRLMHLIDITHINLMNCKLYLIWY